MSKGKLIVFEGIPGSGNVITKHIGMVREHFESMAINVIECINVDSGRMEHIGAAGSIGWNFGKSVRADFGLECAVRTQLCDSVIRPALHADHVVLCKQFSIASLANIAMSGCREDFDAFRLQDKLARGFMHRVEEVYPDLTIFFDVPPWEACERCEDVLRVDNGGIEYYQKMRQFYLKEIRRWNGVLVSAEYKRTESEVFSTVMEEIDAIM